MDEIQDIVDKDVASRAAESLLLDQLVVRTGAIEANLRRLDKIEEDVATLAGHIGEIKATLAEIADTQQAQARQAAVLASRVAGAEQATSAIQVTITAYDERLRRVSASIGQLRRAVVGSS